MPDLLGPSNSAARAERQRRRRHSAAAVLVPVNICLVPKRSSDSALQGYPQSAVTRAIYRHARMYLAEVEATPTYELGQSEPPGPGRRALAALRRGVRAVLLECSVIKVLLDAVEDRRQLNAKQAEDLCKALSHEVPFVFEITGSPEAGIGCTELAVDRVAEALGTMFANFQGVEGVQEGFLSVARRFKESEASLRSLQAALCVDLEQVQEMQIQIERAAEEALRLIRCFEGTVGAMRTQLRITLKSPSMRDPSCSSSDGFATRLIGRSSDTDRITEHECLSERRLTDCVGKLLVSLEQDLCDRPMTKLRSVAKEIDAQASHIAAAILDSPCTAPVEGLKESQSEMNEATSMLDVLPSLRSLAPHLLETSDMPVCGSGASLAEHPGLDVGHRQLEATGAPAAECSSNDSHIVGSSGGAD